MNLEHSYFTASFNLVPEEQDMAVLFSGEGRPVPGHKIGPSVHDYFLIHTVLDGEGFFQSGNVSLHCRTGDTFVIYPGSLFSYKADKDSPWHYVWVALQGEAVAALLSDAGITKERPLLHLGNTRELHSLYEHIRLAFQQSPYPRLKAWRPPAGPGCCSTSLVWPTSVSFQPVPKKCLRSLTARSAKAIRWISLQFHQQISIDHMAATLGYHRVHLSKAFKQKTGLSPKQYLLKMRMDKAIELLGGTLTIDQVASSVGFNDALYFSKQFRKYTGMPPSEYRAVLRES